MIEKLKRAVLCWVGLHDPEYTKDARGMWGRCKHCYTGTGYWPSGGPWE